DKAPLAIFLLRPEHGTADKTGAITVQVVDGIFHLVIGLGDPCRGKGIGLDNVCTRHGIAIVNFLDRLWLRQDEEIVIALLVTGAAGETLSTELIFSQAKALDLG